MIGMQSSLDRILGALQSNGQFSSPATPHNPQATFPQSDISGFSTQPHLQSSGTASATPYYDRSRNPPSKFPPLPGFAPPPHKFATYGIVPSTAPSSEDESEETLPRSSLNAPIEALQGLANAAAEAAAAPSSHPRFAHITFTPYAY